MHPYNFNLPFSILLSRLHPSISQDPSYELSPDLETDQSCSQPHIHPKMKRWLIANGSLLPFTLPANKFGFLPEIFLLKDTQENFHPHSWNLLPFDQLSVSTPSVSKLNLFFLALCALQPKGGEHLIPDAL